MSSFYVRSPATHHHHHPPSSTLEDENVRVVVGLSEVLPNVNSEGEVACIVSQLGACNGEA